GLARDTLESQGDEPRLWALNALANAAEGLATVGLEDEARDAMRAVIAGVPEHFGDPHVYDLGIRASALLPTSEAVKALLTLRDAAAAREPTLRAPALASVAAALHKLGHEESRACLREAFLASRLAGHEGFLTVLTRCASLLGVLDGGKTLREVNACLAEVKTWWQS
ncbi:MAG: hypothetical protein ACRDMU_02370, partial [Gaiellaceae bacterium]